MNLAKLEEINRVAVEECSAALSKLVGHQTSASTYYVMLKKLNEIFNTIQVETPCIQVATKVLGDAEGSVVLILAKESAFCLADLLLNQKLGTTRELTPKPKAALEELGNIVTGAYLRAFSKNLGMQNLMHRAPTLTERNTRAMDSDVLAELNPDEKMPLVATLFGFKDAVVKGYVLIIYTKESLEKSRGGGLLK